ncbi:MAG TPA: hypothetical protein VF604_13080 [Pyrinomonadaceae bacterium]|jgi:hypothetical protein
MKNNFTFKREAKWLLIIVLFFPVVGILIGLIIWIWRFLGGNI